MEVNDLQEQTDICIMYIREKTVANVLDFSFSISLIIINKTF